VDFKLLSVKILVVEQNISDCDLHLCPMAESSHILVDGSNCRICLMNHSKLQTYEFAGV
jgi:hypothetical protein